MSKPDLSSLYKLEFYRKQDNWRLASKPRHRGREKSATSARGDFNKTYVLSKSAANITTKLNDAFLENSPDSPAEDIGQGETQNETKTMNSFNELWPSSECAEKDVQTKSPEPPDSGLPTPETPIPKISGCISQSLELPNIFLQDLPLHEDLWSEKVDFDLNDCNNFLQPSPQLQAFENNAKTENQNILVNLLKKHKFTSNKLDFKAATVESDARKENVENPPQDFQQNNYQHDQPEIFNKVDILAKLKQRILQTNLLNSNETIPNENHQIIIENNDFDGHFHIIGKTIENAKRFHQKNFELINQKQRNFERNLDETTLPTAFKTDLEFEDNAAQMIRNNDFQNVPIDFTESSHNCYLNENILSNNNQYIINNYKPIYFQREFKQFSGDYQVIAKNYEAQLKNSQIFSKNYHPEAFMKNFQIDAKSFKIDAKNLQINPTIQSDSNIFQFDRQSDENITHQNPSVHQTCTIPQLNQIPESHQIFVRNPQSCSQIACDPLTEAYPKVKEDHGDQCFEWTDNFKDQVLDDIDGIWIQGREALSDATEWLNLVVDEENLNPNMEQICAQIEDLNLNTTSSTDSTTFMRGAALVPHSSEISLSTVTVGRERSQLALLVQRHATALKSLLSQANSDNSLCMQISSSLPQQKRHSATNTTPDQSCDYYPTRDVGSNTPLIEPTNHTASGSFDAKLDQLREKLAQDQIRFENSVADQKLYTVFSKFQQYNEIPALELGKNSEQQLHQNQAQQHLLQNQVRQHLHQNQIQQHMQRNLELSEQNFELTEQSLQQVEHNFPCTNRKMQQNVYIQSTDKKLHQVEHNFPYTDHRMQQVENIHSTDNELHQLETIQSPDRKMQQVVHNQQIEHKSGHHNMKTVNKLEMGSFKQSATNFGPYNKQKRSRKGNSFNYLSSKKIYLLNNCVHDT